MMRVLHVMKTAHGGYWAYRQMRELSRLGLEVHVGLPPGPVAQQCEQEGIKVHLVDADITPNMRILSSRLRKIRAIVRDVKPDLVHSHFFGSAMLVRIALGDSFKIPRVFQVPGPLHLEHPLFRFLDVATGSLYDWWIGSCEYTCRLYRENGIPGSRVFLSYYGMDLERFDGSGEAALRAELGLPGNGVFVVGMVSYFYPPRWYLGQVRGLKGHEDLIDAIAIIERERPAIVGVFVGSAYRNAVAYFEKVRAYARQKLGDKAIFLGYRDDVPALYRDFNVAVHPSHSENLGGAAESLLAGVPTIASWVGGLPELVRDGRTGWLVPPRSPTRLAEAIRRVLADEGRARAMAKAGQALVMELLDVRRTAQEIRDIYGRILEEMKILARRGATGW